MLPDKEANVDTDQQNVEERPAAVVAKLTERSYPTLTHALRDHW
jgi:hypothetical protein